MNTVQSTQNSSTSAGIIAGTAAGALAGGGFGVLKTPSAKIKILAKQTAAMFDKTELGKLKGEERKVADTYMKVVGLNATAAEKTFDESKDGKKLTAAVEKLVAKLPEKFKTAKNKLNAAAQKIGDKITKPEATLTEGAEKIAGKLSHLKAKTFAKYAIVGAAAGTLALFGLDCLGSKNN